MSAYLVVREGNNWSDVYRLRTDQRAVIGRAPSSHVVLKDHRCSRMHAEVAWESNAWVLRDLKSRNGTLVGDERVQGERSLHSGDVIWIGNTALSFVQNLAEAFADGTLRREATAPPILDQPGGSSIFDLQDTTTFGEELTTITHRRARPRHYTESPTGTLSPRLGQELAGLYRLALEMGTARDAQTLADLVLTGLFERTQADAGGILLLAEPNPAGQALHVVAHRGSGERPYQAVSSFLSQTVLREKQAVLARNTADDSLLTSRDSAGRIAAHSVICAPIRLGDEIFGLVHLYSTQSGRDLDPDDLEFTLAVADQLAVALAALRRQWELSENLTQVRHENQRLREALRVGSELIGSSAALQAIREQIARVAGLGTTVLVRGESGVGKELVARALHFSSPRRGGPFVCLNCAALSETLLESELFGHEKGAFTGATERKLGKFESAHRGTLLLDEIGEMSPAVQSKFLRVLEGHPFERVGGSKSVQVDVRVVAATNRDLEQAVREGKFRRDLYFRLHVVEIAIAPLRNRRDDIPVLATHFLGQLARETGRRLQGFTPAALRRLSEYDWPGNVRELRNVVERAVVFARGSWIELNDILLSNVELPSDPPQDAPSANGEMLSLEDLEKRHLLATLQATGWNKSQTAGILGIERSTLDRKIKRHGLAHTPR